MLPILLIHGYSAESRRDDLKSIVSIYGDLPKRLKAQYGTRAVFELDVSRYISLEDGVTLDDISRALDRALQTDYQELLRRGFHVVIHSTGALVIRNWVRHFAGQYTNRPIKTIVYLAGALLGSGWAHVGKGELAKWGRFVFQHGAERGVQVLDALELASSWTIDLHRYFLQPNSRMEDHGVREAAVIGTHADASWYEAPIRYAKEDGADGVVRVAAGNPNFNYVRFAPAPEAINLDWKVVEEEVARHRGTLRSGEKSTYYRIVEQSLAGIDRPAAPLAIAFECAHSGKGMGIVSGRRPKAQVFALLRAALEAPEDGWPAVVDQFAAATADTFARARTAPWQKRKSWKFWEKWIFESRAQYDKHAQVIFRVCDQDGRPVRHFDVFFDSDLVEGDWQPPIGNLFEDKHINGKTPNCICYYLRTDAWDAAANDWVDRVAPLEGCFVEVTAVEPETDHVRYLPLRFELSREVLPQWLQPHRTTIVDVVLQRVPGPKIFQIKTA